MIAHRLALWGPAPLLLGLALGAAVLAGGGFAEHRASVRAGNDFSTVWAAARTVVEGRDPYRRADWEATLARYPVQRNIEPFFTYPPWVTLALVPLGALPLEVASDLWTYGGMAAAAAGLYALLAHVAPQRPLIHTLAGLGLLASQPGIAAYWAGQWGFLLSGATAAGALAALRGGVRGTIATAALFGKPHLFPFAVWAFAAAHARARRWRELLLLVLLPVAVAVPALLAMPLWLEEVLNERGRARYSALHTPTTLAHALDDLGLDGAPLTALLVLAAVGSALALRRRARAPEELALWLSLSVSFAVYAWSYDHVILIVPLVLALARQRVAVVALAFGSFLTLPTLLYAVATARDSESFSAAVPLAVFALCLGIAAGVHRLRR